MPGTPLTRKTPLLPTAGGPRASKQAKEGTVRKPSPRKCRHCNTVLPPGCAALHDDCVGPWYEANRDKLAAKAAKVQRAADRKQREKLKPIGQVEEECRSIVQAIARIRDRHLGCISCDKPATWQGQWHGSHFRSHGGCSSVQFHLWNINRACWICNKIFSGRIDQYEAGLVERYGQERVDWLKAQPKSRKYTMEYLERFKQVMGKRLRRMEKRAKEQE